MSNVEQLPVKREIEAGAPVKPIVPQTMEDAYRIGVAVCKAGMAPKDMNTPEKCLVAIMQGAEVGMTPMQSLQRIAVINGRPTIWGDGAIGLVRGSGLCEYIKEKVSGEGDRMVATCEAKRKGEQEPIVGTFSVEDARKAGLWDKSGPWKQYPKRMLQMRARGFVLRDGFADVLGGMYLREEFEGVEGEMRDVTPPPPPPRPEITEPDDLSIPKQFDRREASREAAKQIEHSPIDPDKYLDDLESRLCAIKPGDVDSYAELREEFDENASQLFPPDRERAEALFNEHGARIE